MVLAVLINLGHFKKIALIIIIIIATTVKHAGINWYLGYKVWCNSAESKEG